MAEYMDPNDEPFIVVSSDCHAGARWGDFRPFVERKYLPQFDEWVNRMEGQASKDLGMPATAGVQVVGGTKVALRGKQIEDYLAKQEPVKAGGVHGAWDPAIRRRELDREGVAAEIIFPDGINRNGPPFGALAHLDPKTSNTYELRLAGARAYNRWLAALCSDEPGRHGGIALLAWDDIPTALEEVKWARNNGLFGGILLPGLSLQTNDPEWLLHHPRYEPIWAACEDLDLPLNIHSTGSGINYGELPGSRWIHSTEAYWMSRRALAQLMWSGVFERHPKLKIMMAEVTGGWLPYELQLWEYLYDARNPEVIRQTLKHRPGEYWARQCYLGASPPSGRLEVEARHTIGVRNFMWGSDYPHPDGTWPRSSARIREMFAGIPEPETRLMLGENAVRVYNFDRVKLRSIANRIGPRPADMLATPPDRGLPYKLAFINGVTPEISEPTKDYSKVES